MKILHCLTAVFCAAILAFLLTACNRSASARTIVISIPSADHGWTGGIVSWAEKAKTDIEKEYPNVKVIISTAKNAQDQINGIESLLVSEPEVFVVLPHDSVMLTPVCEKIKKSDSKLIVVDRGLTKPDLADAEVVGDNVGFGVESGRAFATALAGKGRIIYMEGVLCQTNTDRIGGFMSVINKDSYPEIELDGGRADWNTEKAARLMEDMLAKYDKIDAVWAGDDDVLQGVLKAYEKSGRKDVRLMSGGGGSQFIVEKIKSGDPIVKFTVSYPPKMIYDAAMLAAKADYSLKKVVIPAEVITHDNAEKFVFPGSRY